MEVGGWLRSMPVIMKKKKNAQKNCLNREVQTKVEARLN